MLSCQFAVSRKCGYIATPRAFLMVRARVMSQVFVVVAAGSILSFIIHELGEPAIAGWIIQVQTS